VPQVLRVLLVVKGPPEVKGLLGPKEQPEPQVLKEPWARKALLDPRVLQVQQVPKGQLV